MCCTVQKLGFISIYGNYGSYALSGANAAITILFAQICFQSAACGCAQRWEDDSKWRCETLGHIWLLFCGFVAMYPLASCCAYITDNGLWATTMYAFWLAKAASMCGAFVLMTILWYILFSLQHRTEREGRFGSDGKFFIQFDDEDVQQYWKDNPDSLPEGVRRRRGLEASSAIVDVEMSSTKEDNPAAELQPASSSMDEKEIEGAE